MRTTVAIVTFLQDISNIISYIFDNFNNFLLILRINKYIRDKNK